MTPFEEMQAFSPDWDCEAEARFQATRRAVSAAAFQALGLLYECSLRERVYDGSVSLDALRFGSPHEAALFDACLVELASFGLVSIRKRSRSVLCREFPSPPLVSVRASREKAAVALSAVRRRGARVH